MSGGNKMNHDKFQMWKLALSTIHADDFVTPEEAKWFGNKMKSLEENKILTFSDDQISELSQIIHQPVDNFIEEFKKIKKPGNAAFLLHVLHLVSRLDNELHEKEREVYSTLQKILLEDINIKFVEESVSLMESDLYSEDEYFKVNNEHSLFEKVIKSIQKLYNQGESVNPN